MSKIVFSLSLDFGDLDIEDMWPDGDAPENPTVEDVHALVKKCGGVERVISDWNLCFGIDQFDVVRFGGK